MTPARQEITRLVRMWRRLLDGPGDVDVYPNPSTACSLSTMGTHRSREPETKKEHR